MSDTRIGLTHMQSHFIADNDDVILSWPYKNDVMLAGADTEDIKRNESFVLSHTHSQFIRHLLSDKAFTGFKGFDANGMSIPEALDGTDNFIFEGNNLIVLHSIASVFRGKVKLIYIDPPYNTGSGSFAYNDNFTHSTWLTFMKNRLEIAWQLLADDGAIFIQIDDNEHAYLKVLCDELFGRHNFRENIILKSSTESGVNAVNVKRGERLFKVKENILFYSKSDSFRFRPFYTKTAYNHNYKYKVVKKGDEYSIVDVWKQKLNDFQEVHHRKPDDKQRQLLEWEFAEDCLNEPETIYSLEKNIKKAGEKFKHFAAENKAKQIVEEFLNSKNETILVYDGGMLVPLRERVVNEGDKNYFGVLASDLWIDIPTTASSEGGVDFKNGKKPERLLMRIIDMCTLPGDLVLDFHLGSGTTAAVAHKMQRRYIGIEQLDYGKNGAVARLQRVIEGEPSGISKLVNWKGGGSFVFCSLAKLNAYFVDRILQAYSVEECNAMAEELKNSSFIKYELREQVVYILPEQDLESARQMLLGWLDLNYLYVDRDESRDADFALSDADISLTDQFYSLYGNV